MSYHPQLGESATGPDRSPAPTTRGFVQIPTHDLRQYVQFTVMTLAVGFGVGVAIGAVFGNVLGERKTPPVGRVVGLQNNPGRRRTSARRRKRGRPAARMVSEDLTVRLDGRPLDVIVDKGLVTVHGKVHGTLVDLGTKFRAIPLGDGPVRDFNTMAGAVKHAIRASRRAA